MIAYLLTVLTEYISIVLCLHKVAGKKLKFNLGFFVYFSIDLFLLYLSEYNQLYNLLIYGFWLIYARISVVDNFKDALKSYGIMMITVPTMQIVLYMMLAGFIQNKIDNLFWVLGIKILANIIFCLIIWNWKNNFLYEMGIRIKKFNKITIGFFVSVIIIYILFTFRYNEGLTAQFSEPILVCIVIGGLMVLLLESAEMEKKHKTEELKLYEQYTNVFEEALTVIKMKQHEFDNHINAIKCMQYVINDKEELAKEQQEYCENIKNENLYNKVLLLKIPLILSGYLYSKFTIAEGKGIRVEYMIQEIKDDGRISMNDLIEVIGILFDNAVEELIKKNRKYLRISIYYDEIDRLVVEILNESDKLLNTEIEKFFVKGYSTKGENRGMGLYRLMNLKRKYKADVIPEIIEKDGMVCLRFQVKFEKNKRSH